MKIAFYKGTRPGIQACFSIGVRTWCRGPYSHVEAILADLPGGQSLCASSSYLDGGVRIKPITMDAARWDILDVPSVDTAKVRAWYQAHLGQPYDVRGLVGFVIGPVPAEKGKWFCNESVGAAMGLADPWRFDPNSFFRLCQFYAGK